MKLLGYEISLKVKKALPDLQIGGTYRNKDDDPRDMIDYVIVQKVTEKEITYTKVYKKWASMMNAIDTCSPREFMRHFRET